MIGGKRWERTYIAECFDDSGFARPIGALDDGKRVEEVDDYRRLPYAADPLHLQSF